MNAMIMYTRLYSCSFKNSLMYLVATSIISYVTLLLINALILELKNLLRKEIYDERYFR